MNVSSPAYIRLNKAKIYSQIVWERSPEDIFLVLYFSYFPSTGQLTTGCVMTSWTTALLVKFDMGKIGSHSFGRELLFKL